MGEIADRKMFQLVKEMCASVSVSQEEVSLEMDQVLAELLDMGYDIELASRAILECGRLDVAAIIDHLNSEVPTSTAVAMDSAVMPTIGNSTLPSSSVRVELENEEQDGYNIRTGLHYSRVGTFEASTSRSHSSMEDELNEQDDADRWEYDWPGDELTDQGLFIANKLESMGCSFSTKMVVEAIQACGKDAADDTIVEYILLIDERKVPGDTSGEAVPLTKLEQLKGLGCTSTAACLRAIDNNRDADIYELLDYIHAEEVYDKLAEEDAECGLPDSNTPLKRKRKLKSSSSRSFQRKGKMAERNYYEEDDDDYYEEDEDEGEFRGFRRNMKGFGLPGEPVIPRQLSEDISQPPYFYFENVALTPKDEWKNISRHLYNIEPEFVDSLNFSPCRRPRGYVHNLPVEGRVDVLPKPPMSIQELIPGAAGYWPAWDPRVKLNTINTRTASEFVRRQIGESLAAMKRGTLSSKDMKTILFWARKWNLVWIQDAELAPLRPEEVETCLGFDPCHTRVLYSPVDRVRVLGNSFQVNTVAYHLSVLRPLFRNGIRVLSLFSGIGGAEVALHKLGIFLKVVVSVEIDDKARMVVDSWWRATNQKGRLIHTFKDVKDLDSKGIQGLVNDFGGFDLVIGGSPCNNLSGNNRCTRTGLAGPASVTFFEFPRILADVRDLMGRR